MHNIQQLALMTGLKQPKGDAGDHILAMQYAHLKNHIPILYLTIGFYFVMAIFVILGDNNPNSIKEYFAHYILPMIVVPFACLRAIIWYRRRHDPFDREKVEKIIISLSLVSGFISILCGIWSVLAWNIDTSSQRPYLALIMTVGSFSVAYCLAIIPFMATFILAVTLIPICLTMLFSGETLLISSALIMMTALLYLVGLLRRHYVQMVRMIELQLEMHQLAHTDKLTHLLNRRALIEAYSAIQYGQNIIKLEYSDNDQSQNMDNSIENVTMVMLDLDGFKPINDSYGHATGDKILTLIAQRMKSHIGDYGLIARIGGDEFAIMFVDKPLLFCQQMIESLSYILSKEYVIDNQSMTVGISYGLAHASSSTSSSSTMTSDGNIPSIDILLSEADHQLYAMKARKKDQKSLLTLGPDPQHIIAI